jgi:hypothetical protein
LRHITDHSSQSRDFCDTPATDCHPLPTPHLSTIPMPCAEMQFAPGCSASTGALDRNCSLGYPLDSPWIDCNGLRFLSSRPKAPAAAVPLPPPAGRSGIRPSLSGRRRRSLCCARGFRAKGAKGNAGVPAQFLLEEGGGRRPSPKTSPPDTHTSVENKTQVPMESASTRLYLRGGVPPNPLGNSVLPLLVCVCPVGSGHTVFFYCLIRS